MITRMQVDEAERPATADALAADLVAQTTLALEAAPDGLLSRKARCAPRVQAAALAQPRFYDRCMRRVESHPRWFSRLQQVRRAVAKASQTGAVLVIATQFPENAQGDDSAAADFGPRLRGFMVCGAGAHVYHFECDRGVGHPEADGFWAFAVRNHLWLTPSKTLRERIKTAVLGADPAGGDAAVFEMASVAGIGATEAAGKLLDAMPAQAFVAALSAAPSRPTSARPGLVDESGSGVLF